MRGFTLGILMVLSVAAVLVLSLRSLSKEKQRLLQGFASMQEITAKELASDLENRLQDLDEDARVIATLVERARQAPAIQKADQQEILRASFDALATVVRAYRSLALFGEDGPPRLLAVDPTENHTMAEILMKMSRDAVAAGHRPLRITGPVETAGGRHFYLYAFPVGSEEVVITIDAPRFLQSALRAVPEGAVIIVDPEGIAWTGCAIGTPCMPRLSSLQPVAERAWKGDSGTVSVDGAGTREFGLAGQSAIAAWASAGSATLGRWKVVLVVSDAVVEAREQALARQLLITATCLLAAIGFVGFFIVRQQRYSAALVERLRHTEALRALENQLIRAEKLATTGVLAAGIAHEVGTPLGIIRARAELLLDQVNGKDAGRALEAIIRQIDRISSTISQVLDFSRAQVVEMRPLDPGTALQSTLELLDHRFRKQGLSVHTDIEKDIPAMAADAHQFQQVLINVLINACDACAKGGGLWVSVRNDVEPGRIRWDIRDNGEGIPAENLLAVFDPFFTTKKRGEGTGLGLPVAASIVRNHGGEITVSSVPGEGTTVSISWPIAREGSHGQG